MNLPLHCLLCGTLVVAIIAGCSRNPAAESPSPADRKGTLDDVWVMVSRDPSSNVDGTLIPLQLWNRGKYTIRYHGETHSKAASVRQQYLKPIEAHTSNWNEDIIGSCGTGKGILFLKPGEKITFSTNFNGPYDAAIARFGIMVMPQEGDGSLTIWSQRINLVKP